MRVTNTLLLIGLLTLIPVYAFSQKTERQIDLNPKDTRSYSEKEFNRNMSEAQKGYEHLQREKEHEMMRDKTHDGRLPVSKDTSIGVQKDPPGINIRKSTE